MGTIAYLEIRSIATKGVLCLSGYSSHFNQPGTIEAHGIDVATPPEWREHKENAHQFFAF
ncbi:MAG: hypothetical protein OJI67_01310 [Prosthecobacter sp.]|nr:hypothetical protein [Prosthecobacter sp.]